MGDLDKMFGSGAKMLLRQVDRLWQPACDIYRSKEGWVFKFDLAGVDPDEVTVAVVGCNLVVRGTRRDRTLRDGVSHYSMEITYSRFERAISLPCDLTNAEAKTSYSNGLLEVTFLNGPGAGAAPAGAPESEGRDE
jgi:HSP20 family protein